MESRYCIDCGHFENKICGMCHCRDSWKPKEKEMEINKFNAQQAECMIDDILLSDDDSHEVVVNISRTIESWKEKGYIIETLEKCPFCGFAPSMMTNRKCHCENPSCPVKGVSFSVEQWDTRHEK